MKDVIIYTDGACSGNPGPGGWATILLYGQHKKVISGFEPGTTTNNRMELLAVIRALESLKEKCRVTVKSDSKFVVNAFVHKWTERWIANGWKNSQRKPVENRDLWERLLELVAQHEVKFFYTEGHANDPYNNECDRLAKQAIKQGA